MDSGHGSVPLTFLLGRASDQACSFFAHYFSHTTEGSPRRGHTPSFTSVDTIDTAERAFRQLDLCLHSEPSAGYWPKQSSRITVFPPGVRRSNNASARRINIARTKRASRSRFGNSSVRLPSNRSSVLTRLSVAATPPQHDACM